MDNAAIFFDFSESLEEKLKLLQEDQLSAELTRTEQNIVRELGKAKALSARQICERLGLDAGYVSRMIKGFTKRELIHKRASSEDRRSTDIVLSSKGKKFYEQLQQISRRQAEIWMGQLPPQQRLQMLRSMQLITRGFTQVDNAPVVIYRDPRPGDVSYTVTRQATLFGEEYGWGVGFEALLNQVAHEYLTQFKPDRERCWIAEYGGEIVGSIYLVEKEPGVAQLRMLYLEPHVRGMGIGRELLARAVAFAQEKQYRSVRLWTVDKLERARSLYEKAGFILLEEKPHTAFGKGMMGQMWAKGIL